MGLGKLRKYSKRVRFPAWTRAHRHGWEGWQPQRHKLAGRAQTTNVIIYKPWADKEAEDDQG